MPKDFLDKQRAEFDRIFTDLDTTESDASRYELATLVAFMGRDLAGKRILDLGCGTGRLGMRLATVTSADVLGMDISEVAVAKANATASDAGTGRFSAVVDDFKSVRYPAQFDFVLCVNMLHHTDEQELIAKNVFASLKPGGSWIIFENNPMNPLFVPFFIMIGQLRAHLTVQYLKSNKYSLRILACRSGFYISALERYGFLPTMLYNYSRAFIGVNKMLNSIPLVNELAAFHLIKATRPVQ